MVQTNKELRIEDYYDAERNEIIDFPPPSEDFLSKVRPIVKRMKDGNKRVDQLVERINARKKT